MSLQKGNNFRIKGIGELFKEEVDFGIFRMTAFSTNGDTDGKEGRKSYIVFRPEKSEIKPKGPVCERWQH